MNSSLFICQLSKQNQEKIKKEIRKYFENTGCFEESEILEICNNAMDARLFDIEDIIDITPYCEEPFVIRVNF